MTSPVAEEATRAWGYQPALDGLRGVAVLAVLLFHAGWIDGGWLGVSTFFTLSGFLITTILLEGRRRDPAAPLRRFWARRARRLLPAAWLALVGVLAFGATVADATQLARLRGDVLAALGYVANWRFVAAEESYAELFRSPSPALHFWSLAIEEQFYLVFPLLLLGVVAAVARTRRGVGATPPIRDRRLAAVLALGALASTAWVAVLDGGSTSFDRLYYGTDTRMAELLTGAALGALLGGRPVLQRPVLRAWVGRLGLAALAVLVLAYATTALGEAWLFTGGLQTIAALGALVIVGALQPGSVVRRLLSFEPLRRLGVVSYGAYLFHWPIFLWLQGEGWSRGEVLLGGGAVTLVVAELSYRWLEHPIRTGRRLTGSPARVAVPALAVVTLAALTLIVTDDPPDDPLALLAAAEAEAEVLQAPPTAPAVPPTTGTGEEPSAPAPPRVMVVGDSVSWFLGEGLEDHAATEGSIVAWNTGTFGCGIARGGELLLSTGPAPPEPSCDDWKTRWSRPLAQFRPDVVVVLTGLWDLADRRLPGGGEFVHVGEPVADRYLVDEYAAATDLLGRDGARVVWLTAPCYSETIFPGPLAETNALRPERQRWLNAEVLPALVAERPEVHLVDLDARVCPEGRFTPELLADRFDGVHFTEEAALEVAAWLAPQLVEVARTPPSEAAAQAG